MKADHNNAVKNIYWKEVFDWLFFPQLILSNHEICRIIRRIEGSNMATRGECTSSLISVREFKRQFIEFLDPEAYERKRREVVLADMAVEMNVPMEIIADLSEVCRYAVNNAPPSCGKEKITFYQMRGAGVHL